MLRIGWRIIEELTAVVRKIRYFSLFLFFLGLSTISCVNQYPCNLPSDTISEGDVIGSWHLTYSNYRYISGGSNPIVNGREEIILTENGTYNQTFEGTRNTGYSYESSDNQWELILNELDSPKLKLYDLRYFALGFRNASSGDSVYLSPQAPDKWNAGGGRGGIIQGTVMYPDDGFVYLYPRVCNGELALVQMAPGFQDPDNGSLAHPIFQQK